MKEIELDRTALLKKLEPIEPEKSPATEEDQFRAMSLARSLRTLAELDHEHAYALCGRVAIHVLGKLPEPPDLPADEE